MTQLAESIVKVLARRRTKNNTDKQSDHSLTEVITEPYLFSTMNIDEDHEILQADDSQKFEYLLEFDPVFNIDNTWVSEHTFNCFNKLR